MPAPDESIHREIHELESTENLTAEGQIQLVQAKALMAIQDELAALRHDLMLANTPTPVDPKPRPRTRWGT